MSFTAADPLFAERVRSNFAAQAFMTLIGASLERVEPREVDIGLTRRDDLTQQHGGRTLTVTSADVFAYRTAGTAEGRLVATLIGTMIRA